MRAEFGQFDQKNVKILHTSITLYIKKSLFKKKKHFKSIDSRDSSHNSRMLRKMRSL